MNQKFYDTVAAAVEDANRTLEQKWTGSGPRYRVTAITVVGENYDDESDTMRQTDGPTTVGFPLRLLP